MISGRPLLMACMIRVIDWCQGCLVPKQGRAAVGILTAVILVVAMLGAPLRAHEGATGVVKQRMMDMNAFAAAIKKLAPMIRKPGLWDGPAVAGQAAIIESWAGAHLSGLFPEGSDRPPSEAAPLVWFEPERFAAQAESLREHAADLRESARYAAGPDDVAGGVSPMAAFRKLAGACRACHKAYRLRRE